MSTTSKQSFLEEFRLTDQYLHESNQNWESLQFIANDHEKNERLLDDAGQTVMECLRRSKAVHTVRMRVKSRLKLVAKIVRKCREDACRVITPENYQTEITDLVGTRALHLFKEDWKSIHDHVVGEFEMTGDPVAYIRKGDPEGWRAQFEDRGCEVKEHPRLYRSVHYTVHAQDSSRTIVEIQVRTLFEEAWSEIDHRINYPEPSTAVVRVFLGLFNRLAGNADEMGSFVNLLGGEERRRVETISSREMEASYILDQVGTAVARLPKNPEMEIELEELLHKLRMVTSLSQIAHSEPGILSDATSMESAIRAAEFLSQAAASPIQLSDFLRTMDI